VRIIDWADFAGGGIPGDSAAPHPWGDGPPDSPEGPPISLSIGVFDGVHRGHQELIRRVVAGSPVSTVITFRQNPKQVLAPEKYHGDIFSLNQKLSVLESLGVSRAVLIDFSGDFSKMTGRAFIDLLKKNRRIGYMALGMNFRCGYHLDTGARAIRDWMMEDGVAAELVEPVMEGRHPVSSSRIRAAVSAGDLTAAAVLLGRNVRIDLCGLPAADTGEGRWYDAASALRLTPRPGTYRVLVYGAASGGERETEISIKDGKIFIPGKPDKSAGGAECIEFIEQAAGDGRPDAGESE
jgi:riboflavin kinase/FMN adenylyltransferase